MEKRAVLAGGALAVALLGIGSYSALGARNQKAADLQSLKMQQSFMPRRGGPGGGMDRMASELGLTADQQAKMKAIREEMRNSSPRGQRPDREAMQAMRAKIDAVLTAEQRQKMQSMRPPMGGSGGPPPDGPGGGFGGPPPEAGGTPPQGT